jgi:hypothetical protein
MNVMCAVLGSTNSGVFLFAAVDSGAFACGVAVEVGGNGDWLSASFLRQADELPEH